jgi:hypothetical protein
MSAIAITYYTLTSSSLVRMVAGPGLQSKDTVPLTLLRSVSTGTLYILDASLNPKPLSETATTASIIESFDQSFRLVAHAICDS